MADPQSDSDDRHVIKMYDVNARDGNHCLYTIVEHREEIRALEFSPEGDMFLSCAEDGMLNIWNTEVSLRVPLLYHNTHRLKLLRIVAQIDRTTQETLLHRFSDLRCQMASRWRAACSGYERCVSHRSHHLAAETQVDRPLSIARCGPSTSATCYVAPRPDRPVGLRSDTHHFVSLRLIIPKFSDFAALRHVGQFMSADLCRCPLSSAVIVKNVFGWVNTA